MRSRSILIALVAAALLGAGGYWWTSHEPPPSVPYAGQALSPAVAAVNQRRYGSLEDYGSPADYGSAGDYGSLGDYGYPGSLSYRGGSLAERLPRRSSPLIRQVRPLDGGPVFGYVLPDGGGGFLLQFVCDGTGPVYLTSTDPTGVTATIALDCAEASTVRSFRYVGPAALRIASTPRADGQIAVQVVRLTSR